MISVTIEVVEDTKQKTEAVLEKIMTMSTQNTVGEQHGNGKPSNSRKLQFGRPPVHGAFTFLMGMASGAPLTEKILNDAAEKWHGRNMDGLKFALLLQRGRV